MKSLPRLAGRVSLMLVVFITLTLTGVSAESASAATTASAAVGLPASPTATAAADQRAHDRLRLSSRTGHRGWYGTGGPGSGKPVSQKTIPVGRGPADLASVASTHTAYVANVVDGTISVFDTAACNGVTTSGCDEQGPTIHLANPGAGPAALVMDASTHTLYVADAGDDTVAAIDTSTCNALTATGCGQTPPVMTTGVAPFNIALDPTTHTLYTANFGDGTVSVLDTTVCNAQVVSGCGQTPGTISYGTTQPDGLLMDTASHTLYVADLALTSTDPNEVDTVALVDTSHCNAHTTVGCTGGGSAVVVGTGTGDFNVGMALDGRTRTLYVTNPEDNNISLVDLRHCTATDSSGCGQVAPTAPTAGSAIWLTFVDRSDTLYVTIVNNSTVSVVRGATCNARRTSGCATPEATIRGGIDLAETRFDSGTATLYLLQATDVSAVDTATCNGYVVRGCLTAAPTVHVGSVPSGIAVNPATHTAYVANGGDSTVSVIDTRTCAAPSAASCPTSLPTIHGVNGARGVAIDIATDTVYVTDGGNNDLVSVIDGATCNANTTTGCGQTPATVAGGQGSYGIVDDSATHTAYVTNSGSNTVSVVDTRHCRGGDTTGCGQTPATVNVGIEPLGLALNATTHTVYVADVQQDELTVIDTRTCRAVDTTGCGAAMPTVAAGSSPRAVTVDPANGTAYVADVATNQVAILDASTCRSANTSGCGQSPTLVNVGSNPDAISTSPDGRTVYVANLTDDTVSVIDTNACNSHHLASVCTRAAPVLAVGDGPNGFAFDEASHTLYVTNGYGFGYDDSVSLLPAL